MIELDVKIAQAEGWTYRRDGDQYRLYDRAGLNRATVDVRVGSAWQALERRAQELGHMPKWSKDEGAALRFCRNRAVRLEIVETYPGFRVKLQHRDTGEHEAESAELGLTLALAGLKARGVNVEPLIVRTNW